jgi:hypothetical protein
MKVIYIAGKYTGQSENEVYTNIQAARIEAMFVWSRGGVALCPHTNSAFMGGICNNRNFYEGDLELLKRCDAIYLIACWEDSKGAVVEKETAEKLGLPVLKSRVAVMEYLK